MEKRLLERIIIESENENEKCYYEVTAEKIICNREALTSAQFANSDFLSGWQKDSFELKTTPEFWKHVLHYNAPIISSVEEEYKIGKNNIFTVKLELSNGEKLERSFSGNLKKIGFGLLKSALIFPKGFNLPFWAK